MHNPSSFRIMRRFDAGTSISGGLCDYRMPFQPGTCQLATRESYPKLCIAPAAGPLYQGTALMVCGAFTRTLEFCETEHQFNHTI